MTKYAVTLLIVIVAAVYSSVLSQAQQPTRMHRIGVVWSGSGPSASSSHLLEAFRQGLQDLGYVEGQNIKIEIGSHPPERPDLLPEVASALVRSKVDVLVGPTTPNILALKQATKTIPIVMVAPGDPVGTGLIESLARPGGNVTGMAWMSYDTQGKRLQLLKEALPKMSRVADLWNPINPATQREFRALQTAAGTLGITIHSAEVRSPDEFGGAFSSITRAGADALIVQADPLTITHRKHIANLAAQHRLPSMYYMREYVEDGGLMSYGASLPEQWRRVAGYVGKILKGAKPADLPVEQPTKFEFVINLKTAKLLGITIPESILLRADEVIR